MLQASYFKHELHFKVPAKTSRQTLSTHLTYLVKLTNSRSGKTTYGEAAPLKGLSVDDVPDFEEILAQFCMGINHGKPVEITNDVLYPSIAFAFDSANRAQPFNQPFTYFENGFVANKPIPINGLVWMNDFNTMLKEAIEKAQQGFEVIKFKVGALDFDEECRMLESFRKQFPNHIIRLDANGAFKPDDALMQLRELNRFTIHSIEQPIKAGTPDAMQEVCAKSLIPIALDEELIGIDVFLNGESLIKKIKPAFLILKPTLLGNFKRLNSWVDIAHKNNLGWWATSALESNVGLNVIAQWASSKNTLLPQGLGTGSLYQNNIASPLKISDGQLLYQNNIQWQIPEF